jgi:hypothetical protein
VIEWVASTTAAISSFKSLAAGGALPSAQTGSASGKTPLTLKRCFYSIAAAMLFPECCFSLAAINCRTGIAAAGFAVAAGRRDITKRWSQGHHAQ